MGRAYTFKLGKSTESLTLDSADPSNSKTNIKIIMNFLDKKLTDAKNLKASLKYGYKLLLKGKQHSNLDEDNVKAIGKFTFSAGNLAGRYEKVSINEEDTKDNIITVSEKSENNKQGSETSR